MARRPRRWVRAVATLAIVVAAGYALARYRGRERPGTVLAIIATDRDHAVVLRDDRARSDRGYVELAGSSGVPWWRTRIARPRRRPMAPLDGNALTVGDGIIAVETEASHTPEVSALRLADGEPVWQVRPGKRRYDVEGGGSFYNLLAGPLTDGALLVGFYGKVERWNEAVGFDRATGAERWRAVLGPSVTGPAWLLPHHVIVEQLHEAVAIDRATGQLTRFRTELGACLAGGALYHVASGGLRARTLGDDRDRAVPLELEAAPRTFGMCGRRGDLAIVVLAVGDDQRTPKGSLVQYAPLRIAAFDAATLVPRWQLELGPVALAGGDGLFRSTALGDQLGKIAAFRVMPAGIEAKPVMVFVDLDRDRELGRTAAAEDLLHLDLIRGPERTYVVDDAAGVGRLAALDAQTGAVTGAVELPHRILLRAQDQVAGGRLWIGVGDEIRVLDAVTLQPADGGAALTESPALRSLLQH